MQFASLGGKRAEEVKIIIGAETNVQDSVTVIAEAKRSGADRQKVQALAHRPQLLSYHAGWRTARRCRPWALKV
ncbi:hypothetical protein [uncultured Hymenobacter sp.]|uniref:hypothetical protein n=1 Tax=uncultured Hymenobacter sp. TaxID=170016 RepID=UPI0035CB556F